MANKGGMFQAVTGTREANGVSWKEDYLFSALGYQRSVLPFS